MKKIFSALAAVAALVSAATAFAQTATTYKDAAGTTQSACVQVRTYNSTAMNLPCHVTPDVQGSGSVAAQTAGSALQVPVQDGQASMGFTTHGLAATGATITVQWSNDGGTTWTNVNEITAAGGTAPGATVTTDDNFRISVGGRKLVQFIVSTAGAAGTPTIAWNLSVGAGPVVEVNSKAILNQFGQDGSGITPPTGGSGLRGWLSGVYSALTHTLPVKQVDSGGGDDTDSTNHAVRMNCVVGCGAVSATSGAYVDCAITTLGCESDAAWSGTGSATLMAAIKKLDADIEILNTNVSTGAVPTGSNVVGKFGIDQTTPGTTNAVQPISGTTGGATPYHLSGGTAASTNSTLIVTGAHTLMALSALNTTSTIYYLRMYDAASAPTCSSATGAVHSYPIPQNTGNGAGFVIQIPVAGEAYSNGIAFCVTGGGADTDNTNAAAGVFINASYK